METTRETEPKGVGGWLLLLILILTVVGPIWRAFRTFQRWEGLRQSTPEYAAAAEFSLLQSIGWGTYIVTTVIGIAIGILLWKRHRRSTVLIAIAGIWLMSPVAELVSYLIGLIVVGERVLISNLRFMIVPLASAALFTAYLLKSKRVRNTYGS